MKGEIVGRNLRSAGPTKHNPEDDRKLKRTARNDELNEENIENRELAPNTKIDRPKPGPKSKRVDFDIPDVENVEVVEKSKKPKTMPYVLVPPLKSHEKAKFQPRNEPIPVVEKRMPAYKHQAPIESEVDVEGLIRTLKEQKLEITQGQFLGVVNPQFRKKYVEALIPKRMPTESSMSQQYNALGDDSESVEVQQMFMDKAIEEIRIEESVEDVPQVNVSQYMLMEDLPQTTYRTLLTQEGTLAPGAIVMKDPYEQYLEDLAPGEAPKTLLVAGESQFLKTVYPLINARAKAETLLDSGSQIVSISQDMAEKLSLTWDPDIVINMQSANQHVEKTKGLARNVPFLFGDVALYLQVHVMAKPSYDVLLGRPFEVLTESNMKTRRDGTVELTITDPNSGRKRVIPTYDRGKRPDLPKPESEKTSF